MVYVMRKTAYRANPPKSSASGQMACRLTDETLVLP